MKARQAVLAGIIASAFSTAAMAGLVQSQPVDVQANPDGSGIAFGNMVNARFADNDVEMIGCGIRVIDDGAGGNVQFGFCQAATATDVRGFCSTQRPDLLQAMKATGDFSFITFRWDADGECRSIGYSTQSFYIPEKKAK